ncbi:hypothetical protein PsYK624_033080 [Phanerochaete sordida]|uniref:Uncharacterized protein n=1 Tax=Phanerochaete sordida TaxID=48140 RepID=A0A9P3G415_9APHY|nr:hypothetical protein PsYK624_033080 [Phanerochaete sordida]
MIVIMRSRIALASKKAALLVICVIMYAAAASHIGMALSCVFEDDKRSVVLKRILWDCIDVSGDIDVCVSTGTQDSYMNTAGDTPQMLIPANALLSLNMSLGDGVILWRVWVLWRGDRGVQITSFALLLSALAMLLWSTVSNNLTDYQSYMFSIAICISWVTNIWSTAMIFWRAWIHRRQVGTHMRAGSRTRAEAALLLFVESGLLYCLIWVPFVAQAVGNILSSFIANYPAFESYAGISFTSAMRIWQSAAMIDIVGMYPTAVILLVEVSSYYAQRALSLKDMPTLLPGPGLATQQQRGRGGARAISFGEQPAVDALCGSMRSSELGHLPDALLSDVEMGAKMQV